MPGIPKALRDLFGAGEAEELQALLAERRKAKDAEEKAAAVRPTTLAQLQARRAAAERVLPAAARAHADALDTAELQEAKWRAALCDVGATRQARDALAMEIYDCDQQLAVFYATSGEPETDAAIAAFVAELETMLASVDAGRREQRSAHCGNRRIAPETDDRSIASVDVLSHRPSLERRWRALNAAIATARNPATWAGVRFVDRKAEILRAIPEAAEEVVRTHSQPFNSRTTDPDWLVIERQAVDTGLTFI